MFAGGFHGQNTAKLDVQQRYFSVIAEYVAEMYYIRGVYSVFEDG